MKNSPSVTILLTTYNDERTIEKCVASIMKQSYKNYKLYITEAYSKDKTYQILKKLKKKHPRKIILERYKSNRPKAYNHMLKKVRSEVVAFIDGDAVADRKWLRTLIKSFEKGVVAVGGIAKNPPGLNLFQTVIGKELEYRFSRMPKYVARLPTMNLAVIAKYAKKCKYDESLRVAQETEWGYQLNKYGKTKFEPKAVVLHYHRADLFGYLKQQFLYGANVPKVYLRKENIDKIGGDELSGSDMIYHITILSLVVTSFLLSLVFPWFEAFAQILYVFLFVSYFLLSARISVDIVEIGILIGVLFIRNVAWNLGIFKGLIDMVIRR